METSQLQSEFLKVFSVSPLEDLLGRTKSKLVADRSTRGHVLY